MNRIALLASALVANLLLMAPTTAQTNTMPLGDAKLFGDEVISTPYGDVEIQRHLHC